MEYCDVFISFLDSHSDGTHSLQSNPLEIKSVPVRKQNHLHLRSPDGDYILRKFSFLGELFL